jgi:hypothetical protein
MVGVVIDGVCLVWMLGSYLWKLAVRLMMTMMMGRVGDSRGDVVVSGGAVMVVS